MLSGLVKYTATSRTRWGKLGADQGPGNWVTLNPSTFPSLQPASLPPFYLPPFLPILSMSPLIASCRTNSLLLAVLPSPLGSFKTSRQRRHHCFGRRRRTKNKMSRERTKMRRERISNGGGDVWVQRTEGNLIRCFSLALPLPRDPAAVSCPCSWKLLSTSRRAPALTSGPPRCFLGRVRGIAA